MSIKENLNQIKSGLPADVTLVAVTKTHPVEKLQELYDAGQRVFGENKVQEMVDKQAALPKDIEWHLIGHLQSNKVKFIAPFVSMIHSVDSNKLLQEISRQAVKAKRTIPCLLQIHIADEDTKFGMSRSEAEDLLKSNIEKDFPGVEIVGLMGMATNTDDLSKISSEFAFLNALFQKLKSIRPELQVLSMGMSSDYLRAVENGSTMVRIGSSIFGSRNYQK